ncbi:carboxypeptidase-like regulatory domain-containing protein [Chitinophaga sp.]|uniref:carboxypeptidase-like regulatory domain-containing protein n=1 Tax=Chitinophaga sp. TaxID=1869181 RepID=UPI0031D1D9C7
MKGQLIFWVLLLYGKVYAQQVTGTVKDTSGAPVPFATINLIDHTSHVITAYAITDRSGMYSLQVPANTAVDQLLVEARMIGYKMQAKNVSAIVNFTLSRLVNQLAGVEVKGTRPVLRTRGDTLSYKVSDFSSAQDRVIGDVIKKLPGITVTAEGKISYNNKPVSGVYIDGDNLLDDKYNIATNTIPQGAVDQLQVIENHQPIKALQNKVMSDDVALNLSFKKDAKLQLVGQESVGAGPDGKYNIDLNAMMFKNKYKAINYLRGNNTGSDLQRDLVSHNYADYSKRIDYDIPETTLSLGTVSDPALSKDRYLFNQAGILNLNNLVNLKKDVQWRMNAYYLHDIQHQDYEQQTSVILPEDTVTYKEIQRNSTQSDLLHSQVTLNVNRDKYYLNNALLLDYSRNTGNADLNTNEYKVSQALRNNTLNFSNELNIISTLQSKHIFQGYSYINYYSGDENRAISPNYNAALFNDSVPYAQLVQTVNLPAWYVNHYLSYKIPVNLATVSFRAGFSIQAQHLTSDLYAIQYDSHLGTGMDSAMNQVSWTKRKLYGEAAYNLNSEALKINLTLPVSLQHISYADSLYHLSNRQSRLLFNPQLNVKYMTDSENFINLFYNYRSETGAIMDIYRGYILRDYRTLYANNSDLTERESHLASVGFNYRKAITMFFFSVNVLFNYIQANNVVSGLITNNIQRRMLLPYANGNSTWTINGSVSKYSFALRTTFSGTLQWKSNRSVQIQNNVLLPIYTRSKVFSIGAETKINDQLNCSYRAILTQMNSYAKIGVAVNRIEQLLQQVSVNYNPVTDLQFKLSGEHYFTRQQGSPDLKYFFADASAKYRVNRWKTDLELSAVNFMNIRKYEALYLSANAVVASAYALPGRIVLLKVLFNI